MSDRGPVPALDYKRFWDHHDCQDRNDSARAGIEAAAADLEAYAHAARERIEELTEQLREVDVSRGDWADQSGEQFGKLSDEIVAHRATLKDYAHEREKRIQADRQVGELQMRVEQLEGEVERLKAKVHALSGELGPNNSYVENQRLGRLLDEAAAVLNLYHRGAFQLLDPAQERDLMDRIARERTQP